MIHELLQITGSHNVEGTLIIPKDTGSAQTVTGSVAQQNGEIFIFNGENWQTLGAQTGTTQPDFSLSYLVVAGGGGGGGWGGGGGAGGSLSGSIDTVTSGSSFTMTVGAGSAGGQLSQNAGGYVQGVDGSNSSLAGTGYTTVTTIGGGGGGRHNGYTADAGRDGGSGGGAGMHATGNNAVGGGSGGSGTTGQGFDGGSGGGSSTSNGVYYRGGGGGGASEVGEDGAGHGSGGNGGDGAASTITGTSVTYAGGGGSHTDRRSGASVTAGGAGGGGAGGGYQPDTHAVDGTANTGGGGGGSYGYANSHQGGGGSGVIIVSYDSGSLNGAGGIVGPSTGGSKSHTFLSSDTLKIGATTDFQIITDNLALHLDAGDFASRGTSTWTDLSGNSRNGTIYGATLASSPNYSFDGSNDYIRIDQFDFTSTNSVEMWYDPVGYIQYASPYAWGYSPSQRWQFTDTNENMYVYFAGSGGSTIYEDSGLDVTTGEGYAHILVTADYSADEYKVYKNGSLVTTADLGGQSWSYTGASNSYDYIDIGKNVSNNNGYINANVGQFRIYTKVLTAAEVLQNYNATKTNFT